MPELIPDGDVVAPSPISLKSFGQKQEHSAREMTNEEIEQAIKDFGEATRRAIEAGFDVNTWRESLLNSSICITIL